METPAEEKKEGKKKKKKAKGGDNVTEVDNVS